MKNPPPAHRLLLALLIAPVLLTGCVSSRYKAAPKATRTPVPLELSVSPPGAEFALHHVIILRGPGSWKRHAYWDEYVMTVTNHGSTPLTITAVTLTDFQQDRVGPGDNPWLLERTSQSAEKRFLRTAGNIVQFGAGVVVSSLPAAGVATVSVLGGAASGTAATVSAAVLPAYLVGTVYANVARRKSIQREFATRRLPLPLVVPPGESRHGSFFFPISPGPQALTFSIDGAADVTLPLPTLGNLHLAPARPSPRPDNTGRP